MRVKAEGKRENEEEGKRERDSREGERIIWTNITLSYTHPYVLSVGEQYQMLKFKSKSILWATKSQYLFHEKY